MSYQVVQGEEGEEEGEGIGHDCKESKGGGFRIMWMWMYVIVVSIRVGEMTVWADRYFLNSMCCLP
jgi:hypothetical protein